MLAQTVAGKFEVADFLFLVAFLLGLVTIAVLAFKPTQTRAAAILFAIILTLISCAFWIG